MYLQNITLTNFRNYETLSLSFSSEINCITGKNGSGKTNLLDAIHFLCLTKGAFSSIDGQHIRHGEDFCTLKGFFQKEEKKHHVFCALQRNKKKIFRLDDIPYEKISEHIGKFTCVLITPYDTDLIREGNEERRKFFDSIISQIHHTYLEKLIVYNHLLKQRNGLLKIYGEQKKLDRELLYVYNEQLIPLAQEIAQERYRFVQDFIPVFRYYYQEIVQKNETISLLYESSALQEDFRAIFEKNLPKDLALERTEEGVHKDQYIFEIEQNPLRIFGSQGQQKTYVTALKLAQYEYMYACTGTKPMLLLDDIFDRLDEGRIAMLAQMISNQKFGQVFITDAHNQRSIDFFGAYGAKMQHFETEKQPL